MYKIFISYLKIVRLVFVPGVLGGIACFIGPHHSPWIKIAIGTVLGFMLMHRPIVSAANEMFKALDEYFEEE